MGCRHSKAIVVAENPPLQPDSKDILQEIKDTPGGVEKDYQIHELIGKGSFGDVYSARNKKTGEIVALKIMNKSRVKATSIYREWRVLEHIGSHEGVVKYYGTYKTATTVTFVLEKMEKELFHALVNNGAYKENVLRRCIRPVAEGLAYLHSRGIVHRDLKPENILIKGPESNPILKIADFGLSQMIKPHERLLKVCGTWAYAAPEMSDHKKPGYDQKFDCYSFGVCLFVAISGYHPFDPSGTLAVHEIKRRARNALFDFEGSEWKGVSYQLRSLITQTICKNPDKRLSSAEILNHPWWKMRDE